MSCGDISAEDLKSCFHKFLFSNPLPVIIPCIVIGWLSDPCKLLSASPVEGREREREPETDGEREPDRQRDRETERQRDREIETDRQTDRQRSYLVACLNSSLDTSSSSSFSLSTH